MVQWLGLRAFTAKGLGLIPGRGTKTLRANLGLLTHGTLELLQPWQVCLGFEIHQEQYQTKRKHKSFPKTARLHPPEDQSPHINPHSCSEDP